MSGTARLRSVEQRAEALDRVADLVWVAGETEAQKAFAHRTKGAAGRQPHLGLAQQLLGESEAVRHPVDAEECVEGAVRPDHLDTAAGREPLDRHIARRA